MPIAMLDRPIDHPPHVNCPFKIPRPVTPSALEVLVTQNPRPLKCRNAPSLGVPPTTYTQ